MLRVAVPNKGSLAQPAWDILREAGYKQRRDTRKLVLVDVENDVEFFFIRPRDVAVYVGAGTVDEVLPAAICCSIPGRKPSNTSP